MSYTKNSFIAYVDSGRWRAAYASVSIDGFRPVFFICQESERMFITKKYGLVSSRSEYIALAHADRICRARHKAENERYKPQKTKIDKKARYSVKPPMMKLWGAKCKDGYEMILLPAGTIEQRFDRSIWKNKYFEVW